jgi:hypothetical protein
MLRSGPHTSSSTAEMAETRETLEARAEADEVTLLLEVALEEACFAGAGARLEGKGNMEPLRGPEAPTPLSSTAPTVACDVVDALARARRCFGVDSNDGQSIADCVATTRADAKILRGGGSDGGQGIADCVAITQAAAKIFRGGDSDGGKGACDRFAVARTSSKTFCGGGADGGRAIAEQGASNVSKVLAIIDCVFEAWPTSEDTRRLSVGDAGHTVRNSAAS